MTDPAKIVEAIGRSGFVLEHRVTEQLRAHKWAVIHNKYYLDDVQESAREIDLIAYKVGRHRDFVTYTALVVSCKKSDENAWAFLTRDRDIGNPNIDWYPVKVWTNEKVLRHIVAGDWRDAYLGELFETDVLKQLLTPSAELFAFQEVDKVRGSIQNDKNIFNAVSSLMKAEAYELNRLEQRKKRPVIYTFCLLSVADTELFELRFSGDAIEPRQVTEASFVFNYIVNRAETASRIHFVGYSVLDKVLNVYDALHDANAAFFQTLHAGFYAHVFDNYHDYMALSEEFLANIAWAIKHEYHATFRRTLADTTVEFSLAPDGVLEVGLLSAEEEVEFLKTNARVTERVTEALRRVYRYEGPFRFVAGEVPF